MTAIVSGAEDTVRRMAEDGVFDRAAEARRIRACIWGGQSFDERIYGEEAFPFEGASDLRVRSADRAVRLRVAECVTALLRAQPSFGAAELSAGAARFLSALYRRTMEGDMELSWHVQMSLLALYLWGGGRSAAGLWIGWDAAAERVPRDYSAEDLLSAMAESGMDEDTARIVLADEESLAAALPDLGIVPAGRAKKAAAEFAQTGLVHASEVRAVRSGPRVRALELGVDLFFDPSVPVGRSDEAEAMHMVEWLSPVALRARALDEGWDESYVAELLEREPDAGMALFPEWDFASAAAEKPSRVEAEREAGRYQVVTTYLRAIGPGDVPGRYRVVWCPSLSTRAAMPAQLVDTPWGGWPVMVFSGEVRGPGAADALGLTRSVAGLQTQQKLTADMLADLSMLQLPPVTQKGAHSAGAGAGVRIEPLALNMIGAAEDLSFMTPPPLPQTSLAWLKEIRLMLAEATDLPHAEIAPELTAMLQDERIGLWLKQCGEAVKRVLSLVIANVGPDLARQMPELSGGAFPVSLRFNARSWDLEYMERLAKIMNQLVVPLDRAGRLNLPEFVQTVVLDLMPAHAELLKPADAAAADERADEERAYLRARAGIRTPVPEGGSADYGARLAFYQELLQNPQAFADLPQDKLALVQERIQALQFQQEQQRNAQIGRQGAAADVAAPQSAGAEEL